MDLEVHPPVLTTFYFVLTDFSRSVRPGVYGSVLVLGFTLTGFIHLVVPQLTHSPVRLDMRWSP